MRTKKIITQKIKSIIAFSDGKSVPVIIQEIKSPNTTNTVPDFVMLNGVWFFQATPNESSKLKERILPAFKQKQILELTKNAEELFRVQVVKESIKIAKACADAVMSTVQIEMEDIKIDFSK